jgi:hypothetical protein
LVEQVRAEWPRAKVVTLAGHQRSGYLAALHPDVVVEDLPGQWYEDCWATEPEPENAKG